MAYLIKINRESIKENPNAGKDYVDILGRPEKTTTRTLKQILQNDIIIYEEILFEKIETRYDIQRLYSMSPEPKYLYEYTPIICNVCNGRDYHHSPDWDEYGRIHQCLKCENLMEVEYEKWTNDLEKFAYNMNNCYNCGHEFTIGESGRGNLCKGCKES